MGERHGIDEKLLAAVEETKSKLRRAASLAKGNGDGGGPGHLSHSEGSAGNHPR